MVLAGPVYHRVKNIIVHHSPARRDVVAAARAVGQPSVRPAAVVIPRRGALQPGVGGVGVVVHHVHHHPDAVLMEGLNHLLALPDADGAVGRVGGVAALGHIVVHGIVAPVELVLAAPLVHRAEVIDGQQLDMGDAQAFQVLHAQRKPSLLVLPGKGAELPPPLGRDAALRIVGKVLHMQLVNDVFRLPGRRAVLFKPLRVGAGQVHRHAPRPVAAAGCGVGVGGAGGMPRHRHLVIVIGPVEVALQGICPNALIPRLQQPPVKGVRGIVPIQKQLHAGGLRTPQLEYRPVRRAGAAQVTALIGVAAVELFVKTRMISHTHSP